MFQGGFSSKLEDSGINIDFDDSSSYISNIPDKNIDENGSLVQLSNRSGGGLKKIVLKQPKVSSDLKNIIISQQKPISNLVNASNHSSKEFQPKVKTRNLLSQSNPASLHQIASDKLKLPQQKQEDSGEKWERSEEKKYFDQKLQEISETYKQQFQQYKQEQISNWEQTINLLKTIECEEKDSNNKLNLLINQLKNDVLQKQIQGNDLISQRKDNNNKMGK